MARSKSTLSGCSVFLVMGSAYLWRRRPQELRRPASVATTIRLLRIRGYIIMLVPIFLASDLFALVQDSNCIASLGDTQPAGVLRMPRGVHQRTACASMAAWRNSATAAAGSGV